MIRDILVLHWNLRDMWQSEIKSDSIAIVVGCHINIV